jgi:hypothetical protein
MKDYTDQVKLTDDKSKSSYSYLLLPGFTYIYAFELFIHEVLNFVFIMSLNIILTYPLFFIEEMNPEHAWLLLNLVLIFFKK